MITCTCAPDVSYQTINAWRDHYDGGRPQWAADRARYFREHQPLTPQRLTEVKSIHRQGIVVTDPMTRMREINTLMEHHHGELVRLEAEHLELMDRFIIESMPIPERSRFLRIRPPIKADKVVKIGGGASKKTWDILMDEEVD